MCGCGCHLIADMVEAQRDAQVAREERKERTLSKVNAQSPIPSNLITNQRSDTTPVHVARELWMALTGRARQI